MTGKEQTVCRLIESCFSISASCNIYWSGSSRLRVGGDTVAPPIKSGNSLSMTPFL